MNIIFLGYTIDKEKASHLYGASVAGNKMQINVLKELSKYKNVKIDSVTVYPVAAYPRGKIYIKKERIYLFPNFYSIKISFLNLPIMKQLFQIISVYLQGRVLTKKKKNSILLTFNMFPVMGIPAVLLKKRYGCKVVSILADLPIDDTINRKKIGSFFRMIFDLLTKYCIKKCDKLIVLNENAIKEYAPNIDYIVVEGGIDEEDITKLETFEKKKKIILYSGALAQYSGILNLIKAMKYVTEVEAVLHIYGGGQLVEHIKEITDELSNVTYCGKVDNERMKVLQQEAYILVNPRPITDAISKVTFPSKIFEYMLSGSVVLTTRLNGFTPEYENKLFFVDSNEPKILGEKINEILKIPYEELKVFGLRTRNFVIQNKRWDRQCSKIVKFLEKGEEQTY
jgi:glycosyltransferase involved in cell wall biosynthesis